MSSDRNPPFLQSLRFRYGLGLLLLLAAGGYFLWDDHKTHIMENGLIVLLLGACIGMHLFMHGGHGGHGGHGSHGGNADDGANDDNERQGK